MKCLLICSVLLCLAVSIQAKLQNVTVKGVAICNKKRAANVRVKLFDRDTLDPNDLLSEGYTDAEGNFSLYGEEDEVGKIEPFLRIEHECSISKAGCRRTGDYVVPQEYIGGVYDMTYVTLDIKVHGESEKC